MSAKSYDPVAQLNRELGLPKAGISATLELLAAGSTVPFIARYRKEATGSLDEVQLRTIQERATYLSELDERRQAVLKSIAAQGQLSPKLEAEIAACTTKQSLEDLYLPFRPKRRTRGQKAKARGLEPLAQRILAQPTTGDPEREAQEFAVTDAEPDLQVPNVEAALKGARDIVAEVISEQATIRSFCRETFAKQGEIICRVTAEHKNARSKFEQYYNYHEPARAVPSHRYLAMRRAEREGVVKVQIKVDETPLLARIYRQMGLNPSSPFAVQLRQAAQDAFLRLISPSVENDVRSNLKERSEREAVGIFADNLTHLLMAPPLGEQLVIGLDPGLRTGCKCAVVDAGGTFLAHDTINLVKGEQVLAAAQQRLAALISQHRPAAIAVGNGTGSRGAEAFVRELLTSGDVPQECRQIPVVQVNEAGASVYSASELARQEHGDLDVAVRGAISIARRLQDPLAELVKIEPKAIGVGQYQHDVHQPLLAQKLDEVVESCVNRVGVTLNTASAPLLARVAGIGPKLARKIEAFRAVHGRFESRAQLFEVAGVGPRVFEQAAGFLRIPNAINPLDSSAVHPERYGLVERIATDMGLTVAALVGNEQAADGIDPARYIDPKAGIGEPTLRDIIAELKMPGRDPRAEFEPPKFRADVVKLEDLRAGMQLEGVVTNVTAFGAFIDIGVHQDGLVHISELADRFVHDPNEVVKTGDKLKVRVLTIDLERRRISLSARSKPAAVDNEQNAARQRPTADSGKKTSGKRGEVGRSGKTKGKKAAPGRSRDKGKNREEKGKGEKKRFTNNPFADAFK